MQTVQAATQMIDHFFMKRKEEVLEKTRTGYTELFSLQKKIHDPKILSLSSWNNTSTLGELERRLFPHNGDLQQGGIFFTVAGKGILVNPSSGSLKQLFEAGFTLRDIDVVVVSDYLACDQSEIVLLYNLTRKLNQLNRELDVAPHVIRYLLQDAAFVALAPILRPDFREERQSVICLETFAHSQEEKLELDVSCELIFAMGQNGKKLALRLKFASLGMSIGLLSGIGWHRSLADFFEGCKIIIASIGKVSAEDLEKVAFEKENLGYYGLFELASALRSPELLLITGFSREAGDIRLEILQKLKADLLKPRHDLHLFALEKGFSLLLDPLSCLTRSSGYYPCVDVCQVRLDGSFGKIEYIAKEHLIH